MTIVSVIIPSYNRANLVQEAIESVLQQTLDDVEIIVVDDGSIDGTSEALRSRFGNQIHYIYQPNQGRSVARNHGISVSTGRYLLFLDSDDLLLPGALEAEAAFLGFHPEVDIVYADGYFCDEVGQELARIAPARPPHDPDDLLKDLVLCNVIMACHSAMVRRTALDSLGPRYFDEAMPETEDQDLWIRLAAHGKVFAYLDVPTCKYRLHSGNAPRFDESSPAWWIHQESVKRGRFKILQAEFFPGLPAETRERFFHALLVKQLKGDESAREEAVHSERFTELPIQARARLLYRLGMRMMVDEGKLEAGRGYLREAVRMVPGNPKYRVMLVLSHGGRPAVGSLVGLRRQFRRVTPTVSPESPTGEILG